MPIKATDGLRSLALLGAAALCALGANALAPAHRRLAWTGWVPPATLQPAPAPPAPSAALAPSEAPAQRSAPRQALAPAPGAPPQGAAAPAPAPLSAQTARFAPSPDATSRTITSEEAWAAFQLQVPFLDARRSAEFAEGHVQGATSVPVWEADPERRLMEFEAKANPAPRSPIVLYCGGGGCEDSHLLAQKLVTLGYRNLLIYADGFPDWAAKGRPQARGDRP